MKCARHLLTRPVDFAWNYKSSGRKARATDNYICNGRSDVQISSVIQWPRKWPMFSGATFIIHSLAHFAQETLDLRNSIRFLMFCILNEQFDPRKRNVSKRPFPQQRTVQKFYFTFSLFSNALFSIASLYAIRNKSQARASRVSAFDFWGESERRCSKSQSHSTSIGISCSFLSSFSR